MHRLSSEQAELANLEEFVESFLKPNSMDKRLVDRALAQKFAKLRSEQEAAGSLAQTCLNLPKPTGLLF